jgi:predicted  nucleic acid-binding Zn-ribbon protein
MQNEMSQLIELQKHDSAVDELARKVDEFTPLIQAKNLEIDTLKKTAASAKEKLTGHQKKKKELEVDAEAQEQLIKKHQSGLAALKSNDAYKAMISEIDAAKAAKTKIEDDILVLMEALEADDRESKEIEKKFKAEEAGLRAQVQELEGKKSAAQADVQKKKDERDAYAATIPANSREQYDALRERKGGLAIVPLLHGNSCGGCQMRIPPAKANDVK